jgi:hypothetical protein
MVDILGKFQFHSVVTSVFKIDNEDIKAGNGESGTKNDKMINNAPALLCPLLPGP